MSEQPVVYAVPTHLTTREPFVFGRSLDEFAKLIAVACVALKLAFSDVLPVPIRLPLVGLVIVMRTSGVSSRCPWTSSFARVMSTLTVSWNAGTVQACVSRRAIVLRTLESGRDSTAAG